MNAIARTRLTVLLLALGVASCGGSDSPTATPRGPRPSLIAVQPAVGSTRGSTPVSIVGTGFAFGATVMFDRERTDARIYARSTGDTVLTFLSPAHAAGQVNVVVTNPGGQSDTLAGGFTYALPQSLIPVDGRWWGFDRDENAVVLYFKDGKLTGVTCEPFVTITFVPALAVEDGEFTYSTPDGIGLKGTITSPSTAVGTINLPPCISGWAAIPI